MNQTSKIHESFETQLAKEHPRIVGLCAHISGDAAAADDLAQETFVEAWRNRHKLSSIDGLSPWLSAIARNVCLRWGSRRGRVTAHTTAPTGHSETIPDPLDWLSADDDVELELERDDLAALLDHALALLPPETRAVLLERYVAEQSIAEIGARLGMSVGAVKMRLGRGKIALRRALNDELRPGAAAYGLVDRVTNWHETTIWCPTCGQRRLAGRYDRINGDLVLRCPDCYPSYGLIQSQTYALPALFDGTLDIANAYERLMGFASRYFRDALEHDSVHCLHCSRPAITRQTFPPGSRLCTFDWLGVHIHCHSCGQTVSGSENGMLLGLPELRLFRQEHPRLRALPQRQIVVDGQLSVAVRFQSVSDERACTVIIDRRSFHVLHVHHESTVQTSV